MLVGVATDTIPLIPHPLEPISSKETEPARAQRPMGAILTPPKHTHILVTLGNVGGTAKITIITPGTVTAAIIQETTVTIATILTNQIPPAPGDRKLTDDVMLPLETKNATANMMSSDDVTSFSCDKSTNQMSALRSEPPCVRVQNY